MKNTFYIFLFSFATSTFCLSQPKKVVSENPTAKKVSEARLLLDNATATRTNKDWTLIAEFKSGANEEVNIFPVEIIDLEAGTKQSALQFDMKVKPNYLFGQGLAGVANAMATGNPIFALKALQNDGYISAWVGYEEIESFIAFIERSVVPNIELKYKDKSSEFIFRSKEITLKYLVIEKRKRLTIQLNEAPEYQFWTESRAEKIGDILPILKKVYNKELKF